MKKVVSQVSLALCLTFGAGQPSTQGAALGNLPGIVNGVLDKVPGGSVVTNLLNSLGLPPEIKIPPLGKKATVGETVVLSVTAVAEPAPSFQWLLNGDLIPGANGPTFALGNIQPADCGAYSVIVLNELGDIETAIASVTVEIPSLPFSDGWNQRGIISGLVGSGKGSNAGANSEGKEPRHAGAKGGRSVWVSWTAPATGVATFSTAGSSFDTLLAIYADAVDQGYMEIASDDDSGGYHTSIVRFNAIANTTYSIAVDGYDKAEGEIVLNWNLVESAAVIPTILSKPQDVTLNRGEPLVLALGIASPENYQVQWFLNDEPVPGASDFVFTLNSMDDAYVGQYTASVSSQGHVVYTTPPAEVQINTEGLKVSARNKRPDAEERGIKKASLPNGSGASKLGKARGPIQRLDGGMVRGYTGTQIFSTYPGKDPGEPNHCGVVGGASYWFTFQAPESGLVRMTTDGSSFDTVLAIYVAYGTMTGYSSLSSVTCANGGGADGLDSAVSWNATANVTYYVVVDGVNGATGTVRLNYSLNTAPTISDIANQWINEDASTPAISFTVSDRETYAGSLYVSASSSNSGLVPYSNITLGGSGNYRTITVRPALNKSGTATVTVQVMDGSGAVKSDSFVLTVSGVNDVPVAGADYGTRYPNKSIGFYLPALLRNDTDPDGDVLSVSGNASRSTYGGTVSRSGSYIYYYPPANFNSGDSFTYTVSDGKGGTATTTVNISVSATAGKTIVQ